jgi:HSP20 family protein
MRASDPRSWMWSDALEVLARAERLQRALFHPGIFDDAPRPCWEPPADVLETEHDVIVMTALPGVDPGSITAIIKNGLLEIFGRRVLPEELRTATIHRLELPQGSFQRRLPIPPGAYGEVRRTLANGCLIVTLRKLDPAR